MNKQPPAKKEELPEKKPEKKLEKKENTPEKDFKDPDIYETNYGEEFKTKEVNVTRSHS